MRFRSRNVDFSEKRKDVKIESFEMWEWRKDERIKYIIGVSSNDKVVKRVKGVKNTFRDIQKDKR